MIAPTLRDVAFAAAALTLSESTVYELVKRKQIGFVRVGLGRGKIRFKDEHIEAYLASRESAAVQPDATRFESRRAPIDPVASLPGADHFMAGRV